jgi:hypothetical protein
MQMTSAQHTRYVWFDFVVNFTGPGYRMVTNAVFELRGSKFETVPFTEAHEVPLFLQINCSLQFPSLDRVRRNAFQKTCTLQLRNNLKTRHISINSKRPVTIVNKTPV